MQTCQSCKSGHLNREYVPYIQIMNGQMMIVPDVPALVCENCQTTIHDTDFLSKFDELIDRSVLNYTHPAPAPLFADDSERALIRQFLSVMPANQ